MFSATIAPGGIVVPELPQRSSVVWKASTSETMIVPVVPICSQQIVKAILVRPITLVLVVVHLLATLLRQCGKVDGRNAAKAAGRQEEK